MPIPLYYFPPIVADIEEAYLQQAADERRSYNLHTDRNWEKALPNLNPRRSEITVGWAVRMLTEGLIARTVVHQDGLLVWRVSAQDSEKLGETFASALYRLGELHRNEELQQDFEKRLKEARQALSPEEETSRRRQLLERFESLLNQMNRRELRGEMTRDDILDRPILRAIRHELAGEVEVATSPDGSGRYDILKE
jgi:hypothetical protein